MTSEQFLHVASGPTAGDVVEAALQQLDRSETVVAMRDALNVGPLVDVDSGGALRAEWWNRILQGTSDDEPERDFDEVPLWNRVVGANTPVVLWHGPHPLEWLMTLRACWYLRHEPERIFEVALPPLPPSRHLPAFYGAVPIVGPVAAVAHWPQCRAVTDVAERARRWVSLRDREGDWIRMLNDAEVTELPITAFDEALMRACSKGWTASARVVGTVLVDTPIADGVLAWRVRELLREGRLEGRGEPRGLGTPAEIRVTGPT